MRIKNSWHQRKLVDAIAYMTLVNNVAMLLNLRVHKIVEFLLQKRKKFVKYA
jgi:hypothetical protein